jgi:hypothetical protein
VPEVGLPFHDFRHGQGRLVPHKKQITGAPGCRARQQGPPGSLIIHRRRPQGIFEERLRLHPQPRCAISAEAEMNSKHPAQGSIETGHVLLQLPPSLP